MCSACRHLYPEAISHTSLRRTCQPIQTLPFRSFPRWNLVKTALALFEGGKIIPELQIPARPLSTFFKIFLKNSKKSPKNFVFFKKLPQNPDFPAGCSICDLEFSPKMIWHSALNFGIFEWFTNRKFDNRKYAKQHHQAPLEAVSYLTVFNRS